MAFQMEIQQIDSGLAWSLVLIKMLWTHFAAPRESTSNHNQNHKWQVDASSIVCTLIDKGKLANQIATLLPSVIKTNSF